MRILVLTKRQYMKKDLIDDHYGRFREIPLELAKKGHSVQGICLSYKVKKESTFRDGEVLWQSLNAGKLKFIGLARFISEAMKLSKSADMIWACSDSFYGIIGYALSRKYRIPLVFDLYDNFEYYFVAKLPIVKQLYHHAICHSQAITCVSEPLENLVRNVYGKKKGVIILENAVRNDLFRPLDSSTCRNFLQLPEESKLIGTAGALTINRGIQYLLDAFFKLKTFHPNLHLVLAGPRDITIPQNRQIHDLGILPLEKVPYLFNALDVAVVCVKDDEFGKYCFPQKAREIMACDVPIVAANVGSLQKIFPIHPEWLFDPESTDSLVRTINYRLNDRSTNYGRMPSWSELADTFNRHIQNIYSKNLYFFTRWQ